MSTPLLTGYDVKRCQRRVHNEHDSTIETVPWEPPAELQKRFDDGLAFEAQVFSTLRQLLGNGRCRDLTDVRGKQSVIAATLEAMDEGVELILGGWLPDDALGGRTGRPDLLLREGDGPGYLPGDVKAHKTMRAGKRATLAYSTPASPGTVLEHEGLTVRADRIDDFLQLAHYWRMLEASGRAAQGPARGFVIGTDGLAELDPSGLALAWFDLETPRFTTYSRSQGRARRTALERYDFEHAIRLDIARVAESRVGSAADPLPLVDPIFTQECDGCPWHDYCHDLAGDAASAHIKAGRLDVREWRALSRLGVRTLDELAALEVDDPTFQAAYLPEVTHQSQPLTRLATAVRRATMVRSGIALDRETSGAIDVPRADVEVDFDLEDAAGHVYLWGALVTERNGPSFFQPTVSWDPLDEEGERALAQEFVDWLRRLRDEATAGGRKLLAYHYTSYEREVLVRLLGVDEVADVLELFVDLYTVVTEHYFGVEGLGLKKVAPAFGFTWRDEEPSGLLSQLWYLDAVQPDDPAKADAAKARLLAYNEDDVRATLAVREGIAAS